jgi:hypothetical protein
VQPETLGDKDKEVLLNENKRDHQTCQSEAGSRRETIAGVQNDVTVTVEDDTTNDVTANDVTASDVPNKDATANDVTANDATDSAFAEDNTDEQTDTSMDDRLEMDHEIKTLKPLLVDDSRDDAYRVKTISRKPHEKLRDCCGGMCKKKNSTRSDHIYRESGIAKVSILDILRSRTMVMYSVMMCSVW